MKIMLIPFYSVVVLYSSTLSIIVSGCSDIVIEFQRQQRRNGKKSELCGISEGGVAISFTRRPERISKCINIKIQIKFHIISNFTNEILKGKSQKFIIYNFSMKTLIKIIHERVKSGKYFLFLSLFLFGCAWGGKKAKCK